MLVSLPTTFRTWIGAALLTTAFSSALAAQEPPPAWQAKASVQLFTDNGKLDQSGTVQVLLLGDRGTQVTYDFPRFHQVYTVNPKGTFRDGDQSSAPLELALAVESFNAAQKFHTLNQDASIHHTTMGTGAQSLACVTQSAAAGGVSAPSSPLRADSSLGNRREICSNSATGYLRAIVTGTGFILTIGQNGGLGDLKVPVAATVRFAGQLVLKMKLESITVIKQVPASLNPSATALRVGTEPRPTRSLVTAMNEQSLMPQSVPNNFKALWRFTVSDKGVARNLSLVASNNGLEAQKIAANIQSTKFLPAMQNGKPATSVMEYTFNNDRGALDPSDFGGAPILDGDVY